MLCQDKYDDNININNNNNNNKNNNDNNNSYLTFLIDESISK